MIWMALGALVAIVALVFWNRRRTLKGGDSSQTSSLRRRLMRLTNDAAALERLISSEKKRHPRLSELALLRKVLRRLERDRR